MAHQYGILHGVGAIQGRSLIAEQKGGRKGDGVAEDKETRATCSKKLVATKVPQGLCLCPASHKGWQRILAEILDAEKVPESV